MSINPIMLQVDSEAVSLRTNKRKKPSTTYINNNNNNNVKSNDINSPEMLDSNNNNNIDNNKNPIIYKNLYSVLQFHKNPISVPKNNPKTTKIIPFLSSFYHTNYRIYQMSRIQIDCIKKVNNLILKGQKSLNLFEKLLFEAMNGKSEDIRYKADLITSYIHTTQKVTINDLKQLLINNDSTSPTASIEIQKYLSSIKNQKDSITSESTFTLSDDSYTNTNNIFQIPTTTTPTTNTKNNNTTNNNNNKDKDKYKPIYTVECIDFITQENIIIIIDHNGLPPNEYVQYLYKLAKKTKRSIEKLKLLSEQTKGYLDYLYDIQASIDAINVYTR